LPKPIVFSIIESPTHPKLSDLYNELGYEELKLSSVRKAMNALKTQKPDVIVAEFFYAYSTNYSSNHISNLDSLLITLHKYPDYHPKFIIICSKNDRQYIAKLEQHFTVDHILTHPVSEAQVRAILPSA